MAVDLTNAITTAAAVPKSVTTDDGTVVTQSIPDLIAADKYLAAKSAASSPGRGIVFSKFIKGSQVGSLDRGEAT